MLVIANKKCGLIFVKRDLGVARWHHWLGYKNQAIISIVGCHWFFGYCLTLDLMTHKLHLTKLGMGGKSVNFSFYCKFTKCVFFKPIHKTKYTKLTIVKHIVMLFMSSEPQNIIICGKYEQIFTY